MIDYCDFVQDGQPEHGPSKIINNQSSIINPVDCPVSIQAAGYLTALGVVVMGGTPGGFFLPPGVFLRIRTAGKLWWMCAALSYGHKSF
jgi:hypothetical protein